MAAHNPIPPIPRALTDAQVREIKWFLREAKRGGARRPPGFRQRLAALYGVSFDLIKSIQHRRRYKHVTLTVRKRPCPTGRRAEIKRAAQLKRYAKRRAQRLRAIRAEAKRKKARCVPKP